MYRSGRLIAGNRVICPQLINNNGQVRGNLNAHLDMWFSILGNDHILHCKREGPHTNKRRLWLYAIFNIVSSVLKFWRKVATHYIFESYHLPIISERRTSKSSPTLALENCLTLLMFCYSRKDLRKDRDINDLIALEPWEEEWKQFSHFYDGLSHPKRWTRAKS